MNPVSVHYIGEEEYESQQKGKDRAESDDLHREVFLCTLHLCGFLLATHFLGGQTYGTLDDTP